MSSFVRDPTSDITVSGTWSGTTNNRYTLVDDYPSTSTGDVLLHGTTAGGILFGFTAFSVPAGRTINAVRINYYDFDAGGAPNNFGGRIRVGGTEYNASTHNPSTTTTLQTDSWTTNPKTGVAWTVDDVNGVGANAIDAFGFNSTDANPSISVTSVQLEVDYVEQYTLTADTRSYSLTGIDAALAEGVGLVADTAAFIWTRVDAGLRYFRMTAEPAGFGVSGQGAYVVNTYPHGLQGAYSLRKLSSSATNAIRIRRNSDSAIQDIGFDSTGWVDEAAITSFIGSEDAYVTRWYDQSGNNYTAENASISVAGMPRIAIGGVIEKQNGRPAIYFDGGDTLVISTLTQFRAVDHAQIFTIAKSSSTTNAARLIYFASVSTAVLNSSSLSRISIGHLSGAGEGVQGRRLDTDSLQNSGSTSFTTDYALMYGSLSYQERLAQFYKNGSLRSQNTTFQTAGATSDTNSASIRIGSTGIAASNWNGYVAEILVYNRDQRQSRIGIESDINASYGAYADASTATLTYTNYPLTADTSSFTLTGQDAGLTATSAGITLTADVSAFALTGQDVGLIGAYATTTDAGAYTLTGQDVVLVQTAASTIFASHGDFLLTGQDAALSYVTSAPAFTAAGVASLPTTNALLSYIYSAGDVTNVATQDNVSVDIRGRYAIHQYQMDATGAGSAQFQWKGFSTHPTTISPVYLEAWDDNASTWVLLGTNSTTAANSLITVSGALGANIADYIDGNTWITVRVWQEGKA